jgi:Domain of unknown function (DUF4760)
MAQENATAHQWTCQIEHSEPSKLLGETYAYWCQTFTLVAAAIVAFLAIRTSRAIERRKAAAAAVFAGKSDEALTKAIRHIAALHDGDRNMAAFARKDNIDSQDSMHIRYALNHYEYISVAIAQDIYDEELIKNSIYSTITRLYIRTKPYIDEVRKQPGAGATIYQDLECLACKWIATPLKHKAVKTLPV